MADRFADAGALVEDARRRMPDLIDLYQRALREKETSSELKIAVKHVLEDLRSALDYCARELHCRFGSGGKDTKVYFPIAKKGAKESDFKSLVGKNLPGLQDQRQDLVDLLASFEEFAGVDNVWLPDLATLSVENKHEQLTPQQRVAIEEQRSESMRITAQPGQKVMAFFQRDGSVMINYGPTDGGAEAGQTRPPLVEGPKRYRRTVWASLQFAINRQPVIVFLDRAISGVGEIVKTLREKA